MTPINRYYTDLPDAPSSILINQSYVTSLQFFQLSQYPLMKRDRCRMRYLGRVQRAALFLKRIFFLHFSHNTSSIYSSPRYSCSMSLRASGPSDEKQYLEVDDLGEKGRERLEYRSKLCLACPQGQLQCLTVSPQKREMTLLRYNFSIYFTNRRQFSSTLLFYLQERSICPGVNFQEFSWRSCSMNSISNSWASCCSHPRTISILSSSMLLNSLQSSLSLLFLRVKNWAVSCCAFLLIGRSVPDMISKRTCITAEMQQVLPKLDSPMGEEPLREGLLSRMVRFWGEERREERVQLLPQVEFDVDQLLIYYIQNNRKRGTALNHDPCMISPLVRRAFYPHFSACLLD